MGVARRNERVQRHTFRVEDVTCYRCEDRIRAALAALPGVRRIDLTARAGYAMVTIEAPTALARSQIDRAVEVAAEGTNHHYRVTWRGPGE